jgi:chromosome segregation ATPase
MSDIFSQLQARAQELARKVQDLEKANAILRADVSRYLKRIDRFDIDQTALEDAVTRLRKERDVLQAEIAALNAKHTAYRDKLRSKLHEGLDIA